MNQKLQDAIAFGQDLIETGYEGEGSAREAQAKFELNEQEYATVLEQLKKFSEELAAE